MVGSEVWTFERPKLWTFYFSLIRLMVIMQNPDCYERTDNDNCECCIVASVI